MFSVFSCYNHYSLTLFGSRHIGICHLVLWQLSYIYGIGNHLRMKISITQSSYNDVWFFFTNGNHYFVIHDLHIIMNHDIERYETGSNIEAWWPEFDSKSSNICITSHWPHKNISLQRVRTSASYKSYKRPLLVIDLLYNMMLISTWCYYFSSSFT